MKTIKDIPIGPKALYRFRQSAIEDIKEFKTKGYDQEVYKVVIENFKRKFNITEEDLK